VVPFNAGAVAVITKSVQVEASSAAPVANVGSGSAGSISVGMGRPMPGHARVVVANGSATVPLKAD